MVIDRKEKSLKVLKFILIVLLVLIALYLIWGLLSGGFHERIGAEVAIDAPPVDVWQALIDLNRF